MVIPEKVIDFAPPEAVYNIGLPGMPINAVFPTAAPVHDGAVTALNAVDPVGVTFRLKLRVEPSVSEKEKFCPEDERAVASLYVVKSSQQ